MIFNNKKLKILLYFLNIVPNTYYMMLLVLAGPPLKFYVRLVFLARGSSSPNVLVRIF